MLVSTLTTLREIKFDFSFDRRSEIKKAIIKTLAYFDLLDCPLTDWEIYKYLWIYDSKLLKNINYIDVKQALERGPDGVKTKAGFYFLDNRRHLADLRKQRQNIANKKYKKVRWIIKTLSALPFIKMIAVCNSLAFNNAREESDIDLFIITSRNKIWTARFYANLFLQFFNLRPKEENKKDKICLNFFASEDCLDLQNLTLKDDIYFIYWFKQLVPVYDQNNFFSLLVAKNEWINKFLNTEIYGADNLRKSQSGKSASAIKFILEKLNGLGLMEKIYKKLQLEIMPKNIREKMNKGTEVVVNEQALKFHLDDDRAEIRDKWKEVIRHKL